MGATDIPAEDQEVCVHSLVETPDYYSTACGSRYWSNVANEQEPFTFCPYCGLCIEVDE